MFEVLHVRGPSYRVRRTPFWWPWMLNSWLAANLRFPVASHTRRINVDGSCPIICFRTFQGRHVPRTAWTKDGMDQGRYVPRTAWFEDSMDQGRHRPRTAWTRDGMVRGRHVPRMFQPIRSLGFSQSALPRVHLTDLLYDLSPPTQIYVARFTTMIQPLIDGLNSH